MLACAQGTPFPAGFLFGASTSAHQTEGNNTNSDRWPLEHGGALLPELSGDAADSYHRWPVDMDLLAELGFTDYRFGIEWARIEPAPGRFSRAALAHYRRMVDGSRERGLRPMVTLHHLTVPRWFAERGGWRAPDAVERFARYVAATAPVLGEGVEYVCTVNEPNVVAAFAAGAAVTSPPVGLPLPDPELTAVLIEAHRAAVAELRAISPQLKAGWSVASQVCQAVRGGAAATAAYRRPREDVFLEAARGDDWVGVQAYTRTRVGPDGPLPPPAGAELALNGWEFYPSALGEALRHAAAVVGNVPIVVTENGIATTDDERRIAYTQQALSGLAEALADGLDIRGYLHRSALDTHEWGTSRPTFGLIAVDPRTFLRAPKPSARWLGRIARRRTLPAWPF
ncbi:glycoside hydrolase family 1 protein [Kitasatospora sp. McL0602]|uniref:glycoside hydrolase family 1 protein n=1 Tax=Kitasatospora sp. McL0602 TaxID=3439530 RepID=UPI003F89DD09